MRKINLLLLFIAFLTLKSFAGVVITKIAPTPLFPKVKSGETLKQVVRLTINNDGENAAAQLKVLFAGETVLVEDISSVASGESVYEVLIPETDRLLPATFTITSSGESTTKKMQWQPQKQWVIYYCAVSHQDLGFETYYQNIRRGVREGGLDMALEYCRNTDNWDKDSQFRWNVETSEPLIRWVNKRSEEEVAELVQRIKEGRIELGAIHNTISSQMAGYEVFARSFYTPNRYVADMLDLDPAKVAIINDVTGITRSWPLFSKEADIPYLMHGSNMPNCLQDLYDLPVFRWMSPDGDGSTLARADSYYSKNKLIKWDEASMEHLIEINNTPEWAYDCILAYDSHDFALPTLENAVNIKEWNSKYAYPRVICSVLSAFFDDVESQSHKANIIESSKDAPDSWDDQDATDAELLALARRTTSELPTAEKFAAMAMALDGGYPQVDLFGAYNGMVMYHEHTNCTFSGGNHDYYETEVETHRSLVEEAAELTRSVKEGAMSQINSNIKIDGDAVVVYNPLSWGRSDVVTISSSELNLSKGSSIAIKDSSTGDITPVQKLQNGDYIFTAEDVPSLGYKTFTIEKSKGSVAKSTLSNDNVASNNYYEVSLDRSKNIVSEIYDKELSVGIIDHKSPYALGEYIYYDHFTEEYLGAEFTDIAYYKGEVADEIHITQENYLASDLKLVIYLYNDIKKISFSLTLDKLSNEEDLIPGWDRLFKEAMFCAIPIDIPRYELNHELAGAVTQPGNPNMQLESAEAAYFAIQHFADASNEHVGVTLATIDAALVEYGHPRPGFWDKMGAKYKDPVVKPENSNMFLYLMNNFFQTNVKVDQPGAKRFDFSIRSHEGNWRGGEAYKFAWESANPLLASVTKGDGSGELLTSSSFLTVDKDNVVCSTVKMAESNGEGYILRFFELKGEKSDVKVDVSFLGKVDSAFETNLIEDDRSELTINSKGQMEFTINGHGIKTIRVMRGAKGGATIDNLAATAISDAEINLDWSCEDSNISHYEIYRSESPEFETTTRNFVAISRESSFNDSPTLNYTGWLNSCLEPNTNYYYRICAVDRYNNKVAESAVINCMTLATEQKNALPHKVEGVKAIHVSPLAPENYVNVIFYTNVEKDVDLYEVHRSTKAGFKPSKSTLVGSVVPSAHTLNYKGTYSHSELERQMYNDKSAKVNTPYYYKVCAVDKAGQKGEFSCEARVTMTEVPIFIDSKEVAYGDFSDFKGELEVTITTPLSGYEIFYTTDGSEPSRSSQKYSDSFVIDGSSLIKVALYQRGGSISSYRKKRYLIAPKTLEQSKYGNIWSAAAAVDGSEASQWVSRAYGEGTKASPKETWMAVLLPKATTIKGVRVIGDNREEMPMQEYFEVYGRKGGKIFKIDGTLVQEDGKNIVTCLLDSDATIDGLKILVPADKLPKSDDAEQDGLVRISELVLILSSGEKKFITNL